MTTYRTTRTLIHDMIDSTMRNTLSTSYDNQWVMLRATLWYRIHQATNQATHKATYEAIDNETILD